MLLVLPTGPYCLRFTGGPGRDCHPGVKTHRALKPVLEQHGLSTGVGDEGGFAPRRRIPVRRQAAVRAGDGGDAVATYVGQIKTVVACGDRVEARIQELRGRVGRGRE
jgi:enolase